MKRTEAEAWARRGYEVAARLQGHGIDSAMTVEKPADDRIKIAFGMGPVGWIVLAEMVADHLDQGTGVAQFFADTKGHAEA